MLFWSVRTQELRAAQWSQAAANGRDQKRVFIKSALYIIAFLVTWAPAAIAYFINFGYAEQYLLVFTFPLQGFLNFLIYSNFLRQVKEGTAYIARTTMSSLCPIQNLSATATATLERTP